LNNELSKKKYSIEINRVKTASGEERLIKKIEVPNDNIKDKLQEFRIVYDLGKDKERFSKIDNENNDKNNDFRNDYQTIRKIKIKNKEQKNSDLIEKLVNGVTIATFLMVNAKLYKSILEAIS
jgi:hypothetical protein